MSNRQYATAGSADAQQDFLSGKVNLFLFDLKNEALEHGFKAGESWTLQLVTDAEMTGLRKFHHPIVSLRLQPDDLLKVFQQVKNKLQQSLSKSDAELNESSLTLDEKKYLAAYPARNVRQ